MGCLAGVQYACLNGGNCFTNNGVGVCQCPNGYTGTYCGTVLGCVAGGQYACLNNGVCNTNNGVCQCGFGYTGSTCATCNEYTLKLLLFKIIKKIILLLKVRDVLVLTEIKTRFTLKIKIILLNYFNS